MAFEAKQIGNTISWWSRNTRFFSTTERIEIAGVPIQNGTQANQPFSPLPYRGPSRETSKESPI